MCRREIGEGKRGERTEKREEERNGEVQTATMSKKREIRETKKKEE